MIGLVLEIGGWVFMEGIGFLLDKIKDVVKPPLLNAMRRWNRRQVENWKLAQDREAHK